MPNGRARSKALADPEPTGLPGAKAGPRSTKRIPDSVPKKLTIWARSESDSGLFSSKS
jgi:hypothetical protein